VNAEKDCKLTISGALSFQGTVTLALAHQIIGIAIGGTTQIASAPISLGTPNSKLPAGTTAKQFVAEKRPNTDVEKVACVAFHLTHFQATPRFKAADLERTARDAALDISNFPRAVDNATRQSKFLAKAGGGEKQITSLGEAVVNALPNREKVAAVLTESPRRRRKRPSRKKKS
jgi:hypothetical protein